MIDSLQYSPTPDWTKCAAELFGASSSSLSAKPNERRVYGDDRQITPSTRQHHYLGGDRQPNDIPPAAEAPSPYIFCSHTVGIIISTWAMYGRPKSRRKLATQADVSRYEWFLWLKSSLCVSARTWLCDRNPQLGLLSERPVPPHATWWLTR